MKCSGEFDFAMTLLFVMFSILSISTIESQQNQVDDSQKTTISALKFTDNFIRTFYDTTYENVVFVSRTSLNNSDENLDQYITLMVSAQKLMIKFNSIYLRDKTSSNDTWPKNDICTSYSIGSGTLFVLLDIDREILDWLSHLNSLELSNCSWLLVIPANSTTIPITDINRKLDTTQKSVMSQLFVPFESLPNINLKSRVYVLSIEVESTVQTKINKNEKNRNTPELTKVIDSPSGGLFEIYRATHIVENYSKNVNMESHQLLWNILGLYYENENKANNISGHYIEYHKQKQYIWERRKNLNGAKLRVGYVLSAPYLKNANDENNVATGEELNYGNISLTGLMPKLFKIIASELNCTWSIEQSKDGLFGSTAEDGTWNGIIGELIRGELDLSLADLSVTSERAQVVDFTNGILTGRNRLFMKKPGQDVSWTTFTSVFHWNFWSTYFGIFIALLFLFYGIFLFVRTEHTITIATTFATVYCAMLALGIPIEGKRLPGRVLILTVCLSGALVIWAFNAGLTSTLTVSNFAYPITKLEDIVKDSTYDIVVQNGTSYLDYFKQATEKTNKNGWKLWKNGQVKIKPNISFIKENILEDSKLVYFAADEQTKIDWPQIPCNIVDVASKPYFEVSIAWAFQKNSPYLELFNYYIDILLESGTIDKILKEAVSIGTLAAISCDDDTGSGYSPISIKNILSAFVILLVGVVIAALSLYVEKNSFAEWLVNETKDDVPLYQATKPKKISDHWRRLTDGRIGSSSTLAADHSFYGREAWKGQFNRN